MFEWCSMVEMMTSSPAPTLARAPTRRHQIDRLGRTACIDNLAALGRSKVALYIEPGILVGIGRALTQFVDAAMDIRVVPGV